MTPAEYRSAISTLGLSQLSAGRWLGVSPKTAQRYATEGPSGPAEKAIRMAVAWKILNRWEMDHDPREAWASMEPDDQGRYVRHSDLTAAIDLP